MEIQKKRGVRDKNKKMWREFDKMKAWTWNMHIKGQKGVAVILNMMKSWSISICLSLNISSSVFH